MKRVMCALLALTLALCLAACGDGGTDKAAADSAANSQFKSDDALYDMGWAEEPAAAPEAAGPALTGDSRPPQTNAKMVYTADLWLETKSFDSACQALEQIVEDLGGYFENQSRELGGSFRSLSATVRVPSDSFQAFLDQAGAAAHVTRQEKNADNISEAYYDTESRLATQRTKLERLQTLLAQAESMEDIIALESAISDTELWIEQLTGSLRKYDSLVDYATVTLYLQEVYRLSTDQETPQTFPQRLGAAFAAGWERGVEGLEDFTVGLARNWMSVVILAAAIAAAAVCLRRRSARRRGKTPPPPQKPPQEPPQDPRS